MRLRYSLLGLLAFLLAAAPTAFAGHVYVASLSGDNEVPAVMTAATGTVAATVADDGVTVTITGRFSGLESDYNTNVGSHIHMGAAGTNGGVIFALSPTLDSDNRGGTFEPSNNTFTFTADQITSLEGGLLYINVHSVTNAGGEIRAQLLTPGVLGNVVINEVDPDQDGTDGAEFVELFNPSSEAVALDDAVVLYYNGSDNATYNAVDLDGVTIPAGGYFVYCGDAANVPNCDVEVGAGTTNLIQNGADAVALVIGDAAAYPVDTPVNAFGLIDAIVYGTNDDDDAELLDGLGETVQYNDTREGSIQRIPDGSEMIFVATPSPGAAGVVPMARLQVIHNSPDPAAAVVDVYVNDALYLDDVPFRGASAFGDVVASVDLKVDIVAGTATDNSSPVFTETYNLREGTVAQLIATGVVGTGFSANPDGVSTAFTLLASTSAQETSTDATKAGVRVVHGAPDAPTVDIRTGGTVLVDDASYTDITDYILVDPMVYTLDVTTADGATTVAQYTADLEGEEGQVATVLASGFLTPADDNDGPAFGLLVVLPDGESFLLPVVTTIADARMRGAGANVTVTGVVTRTAGAFTYIQSDNTALSIRQPAGDFFDGVASGTIAPGTEIQVTGSLSEFRGSLQINSDDLDGFTVLGTTDVPDAQVVTLSELAANGESYEDELVTVETLTIDNDGDADFSGRKTYSVVDDSDATNAVSLRIPNADDTSADGTPIPPRATITAIVGQFTSSDPANDGYQLLVIDADDIEALPAVSTGNGPDEEAMLMVANPLQGATTVRFATGGANRASLSLYDALGRQVVTLADGAFDGGAQSVSLDASTLASGVYVLRLQADDTVISRTLTVVR